MVRRDAMLAMVEIVQRVRSDPANCRGEDILAAPEAAKIILARY